jgi:hypothetical protein
MDRPGAPYTGSMGTKGYRNIAKSGAKAASARRRQAVAKARTRGRPHCGPPAKKPRIEVTSGGGLEAPAPRGGESADPESRKNVSDDAPPENES